MLQGQATVLCRDNGQTSCSGFHSRSRRALGEGGKYKEISMGHCPRDLREWGKRRVSEELIVARFETRRPITQVPHQLQTNVDPRSSAEANRLQQDPHSFANIEVSCEEDAHRPINPIIALQVKKIVSHT